MAMLYGRRRRRSYSRRPRPPRNWRRYSGPFWEFPVIIPVINLPPEEPPKPTFFNRFMGRLRAALSFVKDKLNDTASSSGI